MKDEFKHIDEFLKNSLDGYTKTPSQKVWRNISLKLFSNQWGIYLSVLFVIIFIGTFIFISTNNQKNKTGLQQNNENQLVSQTPANGIETMQINKQEDVRPTQRPEGSELDNQKLLTRVENPKTQSEINPVPAAILAPDIKPGQISGLSFNEENTENHFEIYPGMERFSNLFQVEKKNFSKRIEIYNVTVFPNAIDFRKQYTSNTGNRTFDYVKKHHFGLGFSINPEFVFNDENKTNRSYNFDATIYYFRSDWYIQGGIGFGLTEDEGLFNIDYTQYDSIGYYNKVSSFTIDPATGKPVYKTEIEGLFDTVAYAQAATTKNQYTYLRFPFYLGINLRNFKRISIDLKGGIIYSVLVNKMEDEIQYK
ncbi:MAG: hypothetical protein K8S16_08730, partial [Bacteroidales bacterium]|nr:hypothetical protein [Bacteroidales bacterium]